MDFQTKSECENSIHRIEQIIHTKVLEDFSQSKNLFRESAFIETMICLRDLMWKCESIAKQRIDFTDYLIVTAEIKDVTDLIKFFRDACCHIDSKNKDIDERHNRGSFNTAYGKSFLMKIDDVDLKSDFVDDVAYFYGSHRIYLKRGIIRAFNEAKKALAI